MTDAHNSSGKGNKKFEVWWRRRKGAIAECQQTSVWEDHSERILDKQSMSTTGLYSTISEDVMEAIY